MNKAFTLIELMAVIIIMGIIGVITMPVIENTMSKNKEALFKAQLQEIREATEKWSYNNLNLLPNEEGVVSITLLDLKKGGFVKIDLKDPRTGELLPNDMVIEIKYENNKYSYEVDEDSGTKVTSEFNINSPTIVLNGSNIEYSEINSEYVEKGAVAKDSLGNNVTVNIQYKLQDTEIPSIPTNLFKTYMATYSATTEVSGKNYTSYIVRTIVIRDTIAPNITIPSDITIATPDLGTFNLLQGTSVTDNSGEPVSLSTSGFDSLLGKHIVNYSSCDSNNNCNNKKRIVTIVE